MSLHERMANIDARIFAIVERQEILLAEVVDKLLRCSKNEVDRQKFESGCCLSQMFPSVNQFDMFNEMFNATLSLRADLDRYRLCCNRLLVIEDERNTLG